MSGTPHGSKETTPDTGGLDIALLALLLRLYPQRFREHFTSELLELYARRRRAARSGSRPLLRYLTCALLTYKDTLCAAPPTWIDERRHDTRRRQSLGRPRHGETWMHNLLHEAGLVARVLFTRQRSFTTLCVLTLALGLGAATAIFSVVNGVLLAPLPYGEPDRLVLLFQNPTDRGWGYFSGPNFTDIRDRLQSFEVVAGYNDYRPEGADLTGGDQVQRVHSLRVGSGYFEALGVSPFLGRTFLRDEEIPPGASERDPERFAMVTEASKPVAILSHNFWQQHYGGNRQILGTQLELDRKPFTIVGIMPAGLGGHVGGAPDVWLPLDLAPGGQNVPGNHYLSVTARLAPGITLEQAQAELDRETTRLRQEHPRINDDLHLQAISLEEVVVGPSRSMLGLLFGAVGAMLAIACINVANLFLARGLERRRELALRAALGAGRARLFASTLLESLWIGAGGGLLGLAAAWGAVRWLQALRPAALPRYDALGLHPPVFAFSLGAVLLTVLVFGLSPAARAARSASSGQEAFGGRGAVSPGGRRERRMRDLGVSLQIALSLVLLTVGGLLGRSFLTLHDTDMGFDPEQVLSFRLRLPDYAYDHPEQRVAFYDQLFARLGSLGDLRASGATSKLPGNGHRNHWGFGIEGRQRGEGEPYFGAEMRIVAGESFEALSMSLLTGRLLGPDDRPGSEAVAVVNQALVEAYFADGNPVGTRIQVGSNPQTIVGVVGNARHDPRQAPVPKIYLPQTQMATDRNWDLSFVVARAAGSTASWAEVRSQVAGVVAEVDPRLVVYDARPLAEVAAEPIARQKLGAQLMMLFAALSLTLAAIGLFGALAYSLSSRRSEIGVRMALGADRQTVLASVIGQGLRVFLLGAGVGLIGVFAVSRWLESLLHEVRPGDPSTLLFAVGLLLLVTTVATLEPALRASRLDPAKILRES